MTSAAQTWLEQGMNLGRQGERENVGGHRAF